MRYAIRISKVWQPLFTVFGFSGDSSFVELTESELRFSYGTADEIVPLDNIAGVAPRAWPLFYGLGAKLGPDGGVAYVGSLDGVVQIRFKRPVPMNVWGPFRRKKAKCVTLSLTDADAFVGDLNEKLSNV